nr:hypothetical protein [Chloroflexota bacterium]
GAPMPPTLDPMQDPMLAALMPPPPPPGPSPADVRQMIAGMTDDDLTKLMEEASAEFGMEMLDAVADDPAIMERLRNALPVPKAARRKLPKGFKKPAKPTKDDVIEWAKLDKEFWAGRDETFREDLAWIRGERIGVFKNFDERVHHQAFRNTALTDECNQVANILGSLPTSYQVSHTDPTKREDAQKAEDFLYAMREEENYRQTLRGNPPLQYAEARSEVDFGWLCWQATIDADDCVAPIQGLLVDPDTVYPTWGGKGLERVVRVYTDSIANVIADYANDEIDVRKRLLEEPGREFTRPDGSKAEVYRQSDRVEVIDYTDSWHRMVLVNERVIVQSEHKWAKVPWVIQLGGKSSSAFATDPAPSNEQKYLQDGRGYMSSGAVHRRGFSHVHDRIRAHWQSEAMHSRYFTEFYNSDDPAMFLSQTAEAAAKGARRFSSDRGTVNPLVKDEEELQPFQTIPNAAIAAPLMAADQRNALTGGMPLVQFGQQPQSNVTGVAQDNLTEAGLDQQQLHLQALEAFQTQKARLILYGFEQFGHTFGEDGERGKITVPYRRPVGDQPPAFDLTPDVVRSVKGLVKARVRKIRPAALPGLLNAGQIGINGQLMSRRQFMEEFLENHNPDNTIREILEEMALTHPKMIEDNIHEALRERGEFERAARWLERTRPEPPPTPGGGITGMPAGMTGPPPGLTGPQTQGGLSLPTMGMPAGQAGGAPPGLGGPPPLDAFPAPGQG